MLSKHRLDPLRNGMHAPCTIHAQRVCIMLYKPVTFSLFGADVQVLTVRILTAWSTRLWSVRSASAGGRERIRRSAEMAKGHRRTMAGAALAAALLGLARAAAQDAAAEGQQDAATAQRLADLLRAGRGVVSCTTCR
jgi:hypothetical protein